MPHIVVQATSAFTHRWSRKLGSSLVDVMHVLTRQLIASSAEAAVES